VCTNLKLVSTTVREDLSLKDKKKTRLTCDYQWSFLLIACLLCM